KDQTTNLRQFPVVLLHHLSPAQTEEPIEARLVELRIERASDDDGVVAESLRFEPAQSKFEQHYRCVNYVVSIVSAVETCAALCLLQHLICVNSLSEQCVYLPLALLRRLGDGRLQCERLRVNKRACREARSTE
ncbi:hypothetical protein PFISCL1PPCAC_17225, partial [Pristionchus fissidentatus]